MKRKTKEKKGITLVALIVTIVILLILATVAISSIKNDGLIKLVLLARKRAEASSAKEEIEIEILSSVIKNGKYEVDSIKQSLKENLDISSENIIDSADGGFTIKYKDSQIVIDGSGKIKESYIIYEFDSEIDESNYGDYINYPIDLGIGNVFDNECSNYSDWRIFYKDSNNCIYIIAEDFVPNSSLSNILTEANMSTLSNYPYSAYWASDSNFTKAGSSAISEEIADKYMLSWVKEYPNSELNNIKAVAALLDTNIWNELATGVESAEAVGAPTLEMFVESWNAKGYTKLYCNNSNTNGYYVEKTDQPKVAYVNLSSTNGYQDTLYYPHINASAYNTCSGYWLASPSAGDATHILSVSTLGYVGNKRCTAQSFGVRPIVCLPSGLTGYQATNGVWEISK